jgi:hypothetical protein
MSDRERYWQQKVVELESSGLSRAAFCRRHRINYQTMTGWIKRLSDTSRSTRFVEVPASAMRKRAGSVLVADAPAVYEVRLVGDRSIRVGNNFESEALVRLIRTVESC